MVAMASQNHIEEWLFGDRPGRVSKSKGVQRALPTYITTFGVIDTLRIVGRSHSLVRVFIENSGER